MAFVFSGVFARAGAKVLEEFRRCLGGEARMVETPYVGFAVRLVWLAVQTNPEAEDSENEFAKDLIAFSRRHPGITFVYLYAECFGGPCAYAGFVFRDGARVHDEPWRDGEEDDSVLSRLVAHLGVETGGYFEPLERDFFGRAKAVSRPWWRRLWGGGAG